MRYPDYYGIDMAKMSEFIAFKAAVELLKERDMKDVIAAAYRKSKDQVGLPKEQLVNYVKDIYAPFTLMRDFCQNGGIAHSERHEGQSRDCVSTAQWLT